MICAALQGQRLGENAYLSAFLWRSSTPPSQSSWIRSLRRRSSWAFRAHSIATNVALLFLFTSTRLYCTTLHCTGGCSITCAITFHAHARARTHTYHQVRTCAAWVARPLFHALGAFAHVHAHDNRGARVLEINHRGWSAAAKQKTGQWLRSVSAYIQTMSFVRALQRTIGRGRAPFIPRTSGELAWRGVGTVTPRKKAPQATSIPLASLSFHLLETD